MPKQLFQRQAPVKRFAGANKGKLGQQVDWGRKKKAAPKPPAATLPELKNKK